MFPSKATPILYTKYAVNTRVKYKIRVNCVLSNTKYASVNYWQLKGFKQLSEGVFLLIAGSVAG